ncbi:MAG: 5-formyltetrahydrofolate cyclo-ligase [Polyangiales bacterium]
MTDPKPPPWDPAQLAALRPRAKAELRKRYRGLRASHPASARAARSAAICRAVMALDAWGAARVVALFSSLDDEVDLRPLVDDARARGVTVCLPCVTDADGPLTFRVAWSPAGDQPLVAGVWGIEEPSADAPVVALEAIEFAVVPCLAVDPAGHRLGYGRGYYDRSLARMTRAVTVAVAFDFQLIAETPSEAHDVPVAWVVTDRTTLRANAQGGDTLEHR